MTTSYNIGDTVIAKDNIGYPWAGMRGTVVGYHPNDHHYQLYVDFHVSSWNGKIPVKTREIKG